jgi:hypothetical protein
MSFGYISWLIISYFSCIVLSSYFLLTHTQFTSSTPSKVGIKKFTNKMKSAPSESIDQATA